MRVARGKLCVGRVLSQDEEYMTLEVPKGDDIPLTAGADPENDEYLTLLFVRVDPSDGNLLVHLPWEA